MPTSPIMKYALPAAAGALLVFAAVSTAQPQAGRTEPLIAPPAAPYADRVSGVGVVEPASEVIEIATERAGVVRDVHVAPGAAVAKGDPLFRLDDRTDTAALAAGEAALMAASAASRSAGVALADERQRLKLFLAVDDPRAVSADEVARRKFAVERAAAALTLAQAQTARAEADLGVIRTRIDLLMIRAPIDGVVLSVDVRPGEFAAAGPAATPLMTIGSAGALNVRVEIDETDIARVSETAPAMATIRGQTGEPLALTFVRIEPLALEKRALAGGSERVDARVIEAVYTLPASARAFVGQRMDVYIEAEPLVARPEASS